MDFIDKLGWKGPNYEKLKMLLSGWKAESDDLESQIEKKEQDIETYEYELSMLTDQVAYTNKTVNDTISSQNASISAIDRMKHQQIILQDNYKQQQDDIANYKQSYEDLKQQIEYSKEWPEDKLLQKQSLDQQCNEISIKVDNNLATIQTIRNDIELLSKEHQEYESEISSLDNKLDEYNSKLLLITDKHAQQQTNINVNAIKEEELRDISKQLQNTIYQKQRLNRSEETSLLDLESRKHNNKEEYNILTKKYEALGRTQQELITSKDLSSNLNSKLALEIKEIEEYITLRKQEISNFKKDIMTCIQQKNENLEKIQGACILWYILFMCATLYKL